MGDNEQAPDPRYEWVMRQVVSHFKTTNLDNFSFSQAEEVNGDGRLAREGGTQAGRQAGRQADTSREAGTLLA